MYSAYQHNSGIYSQNNDRFGIPYGKVNISANPAVKNPNYVDALSNNLVIKIGNDTIPYQMVGLSNNQFSLIANVDKSYYG